jgi:transposase, IS30 family
MSKNYNHLSQEQRYQIQALLEAGTLQKEIASILKVHPSTVSRELKRNTPQGGTGAFEYRAKNAQRRTDLRHKEKPKAIKFIEDWRKYARDKLLKERYSPELIHAEGVKTFGDFVSHETIYKWIWRCKKGNKRSDRPYKNLYRYLAHGKRRQKRGNRHDSRGIIHNRVSIEYRPLIVNKRQRPGDFEVDLMLGKNHKGALVVMTDRASLYTKLKYVSTKEADKVRQAIQSKLRPIKDYVKTLTFDNDQAFYRHIEIGEYLEAQTYFTRPYTSQDKGTVENRIGVIRRFWPKRTDLTKVTIEEIQKVENYINNRPVRKFNYKTPNQVFLEKIALAS